MATLGKSRRGFRIVFLGLLLVGGLVPLKFWWDRYRLEALAAQCLEAIQNENWDAAQPLAERWVRQSPEDAEAWLNLAEVAKSQGDFEAVSECLGRIPPSDRRYLNSQFLLADLCLEEFRRPDRAVAAWKAILTVDPKAHVAHQRLIYVYSMTLQRDLLVKQMREAIQQHAEPPESYGYMLSAPNLVFSNGYLKVSDWLQAKPDDETLRVAQAVYAARTNPSKGMKMFGSHSVQMGDAKLVMECLKDYPNHLELQAFVIEQAIAEADMAALGRALQKLPKEAAGDSRFWRYIGTFRDSQRRIKDAAEAFHQSIQLHPLDWKSHHELGAIERVLGHGELAAKHAELGARGKQLEREFMELPNATQADAILLEKLLRFARDCGDQDVVDGLNFRLHTMETSTLAGLKNLPSLCLTQNRSSVETR